MPSLFTVFASAFALMAIVLGAVANAELTTVSRGNILEKRRVLGGVGGRQGTVPEVGRGFQGGMGAMAAMGQPRRASNGVQRFAAAKVRRRGF
jgi:hypothetical protein